MGDIINMQDALNRKNRVYLRNKLKPSMNKKGIKGFFTLVAPGSARKYSLKQNQRKVQLYGRTILGIATAISTIAIGSVAFNGNSINNNTFETQEILQQDNLMEIAENRLLECVFGDELNNIDSPDVIYDTMPDGCRILKITSGTDDSKKVLFTYSRNLFTDPYTNAKEIVSLIDNAIDVQFSENASQKKLQDLKKSIEKSEDKNFKFRNGHIIEDKQIENDYER